MKPTVYKRNSAQEFATEERCWITELQNDESSPELSIAQARVQSGVTTAWHKLANTAERYVILSGAGRMEIGGMAPCDVGAGDVVCIPPDTPQRVRNTGAGELIFFAICTPRFRPANYIDLESTQNPPA